MIEVNQSPVTVRTEDIVMPTYSVERRSSLPPIFDPESTYPYAGYLTTDAEPQPKTYKAVIVENGLIAVSVLPELGGRILQIENTQSGTKYLHENDVVRPTRIPPRWAFISLGIELNFPGAHSPTGNDPVGYEIIERADGSAGVAVGEQEIRWGVSWRAEVKLFPGFRGVCMSTCCWNPTDTTRSVQWWSNAAHPADGNTEFVFPNEPLIAHIEGDDGEQHGLWPCLGTHDLRWHHTYDSMCGSFTHPTQTDWFGIFHHSRGWGLLHLSDVAELPGKKLWSFGHTGPTADWTDSMTRSGGRICEIQAGIPTTQHDSLALEANQEISFVEFWIPVDSRDELDEPKRPSFGSLCEQLGGRAVLGAPRKTLDSPSGAFWKELVAAFRQDNTQWLNGNSTNLRTLWPPTGLELDPALQWASELKGGDWTYLYALLLCAKERWDDAGVHLQGLLRQSPEFAEARAAFGLLLWKGLNQPEKAWPQIRQALGQLADGQLFVHANELTRQLNLTEDRKQLLLEWPDGDFRRRETEAEIALDSGNPQEAIRILLDQPWERHHCRWRRTEIWLKARESLGRSKSPIPSELAEDPFRVDV